MSKVVPLSNLILDILFPRKPYCTICGGKLTYASEILCQSCRNKIKPLCEPLCSKCGKPMQSPKRSTLCQDCKEDFHSFVQARSYGYYEGIMKELIYQFKYHGKRELAEVLGSLMYGLLNQLSWPSFDYIVPLPLHPKRLRERGYNQAYLLAEVVANLSGIPIYSGLIRVKPTEHQTLLDKALRKQNLIGAFKVVDSDKVSDKTLLLIDDVYTTGATTGECAKCLIEAGAHAVYVLTCARG